MDTKKILALKYRPQVFSDLIGQEIISETITNSIKLEKTPNAYLLTGIRGVGKTTTARLIAKSLNCSKNNNNGSSCPAENFCDTCKQIASSNHIDVLEMDAASKTGIDDIRELIENSKYSPVSAKFKIYIIDEVHMLSKQAFNGLLKTLEEPPLNLKFILATTEIKKIPVTVLSRCQRFDLKRVSFEKLFNHLKKISKIEKGNISDAALRLITKVSEGSVRDSISLLDRALLMENLSSKSIVDEQEVREMLGVADRGKILNLFDNVLNGNEKKAISELNSLHEEGMDSKIFLNDILEILHLISRCKSLGEIDNDPNVSNFDAQIIQKISKGISLQDIGIFWQLTIKTLEDIKIVSSELISLEMYLIQLMHVTEIDKNFINNTEKKKIDVDIKSSSTKPVKDENKNLKEISKSQLKSTDQIQTDFKLEKDHQNKEDNLKITNLNDLVEICTKENELELKFDLERNVTLVSFSNGKIDIGFNENLNKNFIKNLTEKLLLWTGKRWIISLSKSNGEKTLFEKKKEKQTEEIVKFKDDNKFKEFLEYFPDVIVDKIKGDNDA